MVDDLVNSCQITMLAATSRNAPRAWLVTHVDDGEVGRAGNRAEAVAIAAAYVARADRGERDG
jgi:hypothetical protein